jgi:hypothetical protein
MAVVAYLEAEGDARSALATKLLTVCDEAGVDPEKSLEVLLIAVSTIVAQFPPEKINSVAKSCGRYIARCAHQKPEKPQ